jgi:hypothetical protein
MAHGMSSGKKLIGASAAYAVASELLFRGYNVAFPEFDMGRGDDLVALSPDTGEVKRFQVRSRQLNRYATGEEGKSTEIYVPAEISEHDYPLDFVAIALRYQQSWLLGLFDSDSIETLKLEGVGGATKHVTQETYDLRATVDRESKTIRFSGVDVTQYFNILVPSQWDKHFPIRINDAKQGKEKNLDQMNPARQISALDLFSSPT